jgi:hypothetical protein
MITAKERYQYRMALAVALAHSGRFSTYDILAMAQRIQENFEAWLRADEVEESNE